MDIGELLVARHDQGGGAMRPSAAANDTPPSGAARHRPIGSNGTRVEDVTTSEERPSAEAAGPGSPASCGLDRRLHLA